MAKVPSSPKTRSSSSSKSGSKKSIPVKTKKHSATKASDNVSSTSKINKTSKTISKIKSTKISKKKEIKKNVRELSWLQSLIEPNKTRKEWHLKSGILAQCTHSLTLKKANGVEYAIFPWKNGKGSGFVKMNPGGVKDRSKTSSTLHFAIVLGKLQLLAENRATEYECGTMITIPKGIHYGLKNSTKEATYLRFQTVHAD